MHKIINVAMNKLRLFALIKFVFSTNDCSESYLHFDVRLFYIQDYFIDKITRFDFYLCSINYQMFLVLKNLSVKVKLA